MLEQNYRYKMMYSPDYSNVDTQEVHAPTERCCVPAAQWPAGMQCVILSDCGPPDAHRCQELCKAV